MKEKFKNRLILVLFVTIGILLGIRQCSPSKIGESVLNQRKGTSWIDTIRIPQEVVKFKSKYYPKWDSILKIDTLFLGSPCDFVRFYNDSLSDSNITIYSDQEIIGILKESNTSYKLKVPIYIKETREIHDTKIIPNKLDLFVNSSVGGNQNQFNVSIGAGLRFKKVYYGYNYEAINKTHNITIGYKIFSSKR